MHWNRSTAKINEELNQALACGIESSTQPLFAIGFSRTVLDGLLSATAIDRLAADRRVPIGATVSIGGSGLLWLTYLLKNRNEPKSPSTDSHENRAAVTDTIVYAGADVATQMASTAMLAPRLPTLVVEQTQSLVSADPKLRQSGLGAEQNIYVAPIIEPQAIVPFDALPFVVKPARKPPNQISATRLEQSSEQMMVRAAVALLTCALVAAALILS